MAKTKLSFAVFGSCLFVISCAIAVFSKAGPPREIPSNGVHKKRDLRQVHQRRKLEQFVARHRMGQQYAGRAESEIDADRDNFNCVFSEIVGKTDAIIVEMEQLLKSPIGKGVLGCLHLGQIRNRRRLETPLGIDFFDDVRRIVFADQFILAEGDLAEVVHGRYASVSVARQYGSHGTLLLGKNTHREGQPKVGLWKDRLLVVSSDVDELEETIDILERRQSCDNQDGRFFNWQGMIYGSLSVSKLIRIINAENVNDEIVRLLKENVKHVNFDVNATSDLQITVKMETESMASAADLLAAFENVMSVLKVKATADDGVLRSDSNVFADVDREGKQVYATLRLSAETFLSSCR